jgi:membrane-associated phospholipid phosphatase
LAPFKYTWYFAAFFASQIIIATMFLRWHYLIDICAGITLAAGCVVLSTYLEEWESARRGKLGVPPVFDEPPLFRKAS